MEPNENINKSSRSRIRIYSYFSAILTCLSIAAPAAPLDFSVTNLPNGTPYLLAIGSIEAGDASKFSRISDQNPTAAFIALASPGGLVLEALKIGTEIRRRELNTAVVPDEKCVSACLLVFIGGVKRVVAPGAELGSHQFSVAESDGQGKAPLSGGQSQSMSAMLLRYFMDMGVSPEALAHILETRPRDLFIFSKDGLQSYRLVTAGNVWDRRIKTPPRKVLVDRCTGQPVEPGAPPLPCSPEQKWGNIVVPEFLARHPEYKEKALYDILDKVVRGLQKKTSNLYDPALLEIADQAIKERLARDRE